VTGSDHAASCTEQSLKLDVLLQTEEDAFAGRVEAACRHRGHQLARVRSLRDLTRVAYRRTPTVLLLDMGGLTARSVRIAATVSAAYADVPVVIVAEEHRVRSKAGFRVIDKHWAGERIADELELAYIGIPASIDDV
jgi:hypothetical protein